MAPEQLSLPTTPPTPAVDIFALGGVITYAATGDPPFGYDPAVGYRIEHQEPDLDALRKADQALAAVVASCLAKDPANRPTATELSRARATSRVPSWPAPVVDRISTIRSLILLQPDAHSPAVVTSPTVPPAALAGRLSDRLDDGTGATSLGTGPDSPASQRPASHRPASHRRSSQRSAPPSEQRAKDRTGKRRRRRLTLILMPLVIAAGCGVTALSLSPLMQPRPKPPAHVVVTKRTHPSPIHSKRDMASTAPTTSPVPVVVPTPTPRKPSVVSFSSYGMLENKAQHPCLIDSGNFAVESLSCTSGSFQGWKAVKESGNEFELTDQPYGYCLNDSYSLIWSYPCTPSHVTTTWWRIGTTTTSAGGTLVDTVTGECLIADTSGFSMATCDASDPRQLWYDARNA